MRLQRPACCRGVNRNFPVPRAASDAAREVRQTAKALRQSADACDRLLSVDTSAVARALSRSARLSADRLEADASALERRARCLAQYGGAFGMNPHLPTPDLGLGNLTRRQAAVFEHICGRARAGIQREADMHEEAMGLPLASESVVAEHRQGLRECRRELDLVAGLHNRLTRLRAAPLTAEECARLDRARAAKPDLTSAEAALVIYGMLDPPEIEATSMEIGEAA